MGIAKKIKMRQHIWSNLHIICQYLYIGEAFQACYDDWTCHILIQVNVDFFNKRKIARGDELMTNRTFDSKRTKIWSRQNPRRNFPKPFNSASVYEIECGEEHCQATHWSWLFIFSLVKAFWILQNNIRNWTKKK